MQQAQTHQGKRKPQLTAEKIGFMALSQPERHIGSYGDRSMNDMTRAFMVASDRIVNGKGKRKDK